MNHYRDDYPELDDAAWLHSITVMKKSGEMKFGTFACDNEWQDRPGDMGGIELGLDRIV